MSISTLEVIYKLKKIFIQQNWKYHDMVLVNSMAKYIHIQVKTSYCPPNQLTFATKVDEYLRYIDYIIFIHVYYKSVYNTISTILNSQTLPGSVQ